MANRRIKDLDERTTLSSGDYIATDNINGTRKVEVTKITNPINQVTQKVSNASDAYSETKAYKVGDIVIQNNTLYVCSTACSAASWAVNQNNFTATTVASELGDLNSALSNIANKVTKYSFTSSLTANQNITKDTNLVLTNARVLYAEMFKNNISYCIPYPSGINMVQIYRDGSRIVVQPSTTTTDVFTFNIYIASD